MHSNCRETKEQDVLTVGFPQVLPLNPLLINPWSWWNHSNPSQPHNRYPVMLPQATKERETQRERGTCDTHSIHEYHAVPHITNKNHNSWEKHNHHLQKPSRWITSSLDTHTTR